MKKFVKFLLLLCLLTNSIFSYKNIKGENCFADSETDKTTYAKASVGCILYKTQEMNNSYENVLFVIPETYFVMVLETINDNCFKVQYDKFIGYVEASTVVIATFVPILKTLSNITFDIKTTSGTQIWQYPTTKSSICTTLGAGTKNISYVAFAYGSVPTGGESNIWYYVYYTPDENSTNVYEGYIYSENATNLSEIVANTETNPEEIIEEKQDEKVIFISSTIKTIIITIIAVPVILFLLIILYKFTQKLRKNTIKAKNKINSKSDNLNFKRDNFQDNQMEKYKNMKLVKHKKLVSDLTNFDDDDLLWIFLQQIVT